MNDKLVKRTRLIDAAIDLLLEQGYAATTIQQVAEKAGVSKGAVYLYFKSKNELMLAIMDHLDVKTKDEVAAIRASDAPPRERLRTQITYQLNEVLENQQIIEVYLRESEIGLNEEMLLLAQRIRADWQKIQEDFIYDVFGDPCKEYLTDLAVTLNGIINEYYMILLLDKVNLNTDKVADYLVQLMDAWVPALIQSDLKPLLTPEVLPNADQISNQLKALSRAKVDQALAEMRTHAESLQDPAAQELSGSLDLIVAELEKDKPNTLLIQGMLAGLREHKAIAPQRKVLADELDLKLI